jgi:hypothetical protein
LSYEPTRGTVVGMKKMTSAGLIATTIAVGTHVKSMKIAISRVFIISIVGLVMTNAIMTVIEIGNVPETVSKNVVMKSAIRISPVSMNARTSMRKVTFALRIVLGSAEKTVNNNAKRKTVMRSSFKIVTRILIVWMPVMRYAFISRKKK